MPSCCPMLPVCCTRRCCSGATDQSLSCAALLAEQRAPTVCFRISFGALDSAGLVHAGGPGMQFGG